MIVVGRRYKRDGYICLMSTYTYPKAEQMLIDKYCVYKNFNVLCTCTIQIKRKRFKKEKKINKYYSTVNPM